MTRADVRELHYITHVDNVASIELRPRRWYRRVCGHLLVGGGVGFAEKLDNPAGLHRADGIYILLAGRAGILYVGRTTKTRRGVMDFATRLYRHSTRKASNDSPVFRKLWEYSEHGKRLIPVCLVSRPDVCAHFPNPPAWLSEETMIALLEIALIEYLSPEVNSPQKPR
ncbi:MAG: hypothetical protein R6X12_09250 [bacterium]